jgi:hypothetical protein
MVGSETFNFPTRIQGNSATAIDNIFINIMRKDDYSISQIINGLSNHDAQSITLNKLNINLYAKQFKIIREINKQTIGEFLIKLSYETWDQSFSSENVNEMLNLFLDKYLKIITLVFYKQKKSKFLTIPKNGLRQV